MKLIELVDLMATRLERAGVAFGHGTTNAFDEAAWLVLWRLGKPLDALDDIADQALSAAQQTEVEALVAQRINTRQPAAYLTGEAWLHGVPFTVDARCIVPRSLIAELLAHPDYQHALDTWLSDRTQRVLDLCTGNASLAVLAAMAFPDVVVDAADLSADALAVAALNVARHGLEQRIALYLGDGLAALPRESAVAEPPRDNGSAAEAKRYDLILCNPPYVNSASMAALPDEFRAEPELALAGGADGMDFVRVLLAHAAEHLSPEGVLVLEIGHERAFFDAAFAALDVVWLPTSAGDDQVMLITRDALLAAAPPR